MRERDLDAPEATSTGDDAVSKVARRISPGSTVLDVGTGTGALGRYLAGRGCTVDGIERDPARAVPARPHYRTLHELDLEAAPLRDALGLEKYDVVVCANVLEHLRDPGRVLDSLVERLRPDGRILISGANVSYAGVVAALEFLREHRLAALSLEAVACPARESPCRDHDPEALPPAGRQAVAALPDVLAYQFVVEAARGVETRDAGSQRGPGSPREDPAPGPGTRRAESRAEALAAEIAELTARHRELCRRLEAAERPSRLRRSIQELRRALISYRCTLEPERAPGGAASTVDRDLARVRLRPRSGRLPAGWVEVDFEIEGVGGVPLAPRLFADDGAGWLEESPTPLPSLAGGRSRGLVKLPDRVTDLCLDPRAEDGKWRIGSLTVREISRAEAASRLGTRLLARGVRRPGALVGAVGESVALYRARGWPALKRRFREEAFASDAPRDYAAWIREFDVLTRADRDRVARRSALLSERLGFTVVLLLSPEDEDDSIEATLASVEGQLFQGWTGIVVDVAGGPGAGRAGRPARRHARWSSPPVRTAAELREWAQAPLVAFVRPGDVLAPHALYALAEAFEGSPEAEVVYPDEDAFEGGARASPWFKPDWSAYRLLGQDYIGHRFACRADALARGVLPEALEIVPFALLLEVSRRRGVVRHVPFVLHHVRAKRKREMAAARRALEEHLQLIAPGAKAEPGRLAETFRIRLALPPEPPLVSILVPTRDRVELLRRCIETLRARTAYPSYEILVVDHESRDPEARRYLGELQERGIARVLPYAGEFNFAAINNFAVRHARGTVLALLNNDVEVRDAGWLSEMVSWALREDVGAVGCRLTYGDGRVQHVGVVLGMGALAGHVHQRIQPEEPGHGGAAWVLREVGAVTAACLVLRREVYDEAGGLDERLRVAFNDVDLCLRIRERGRVVVFTPYAELLHLESATRGHGDSPDDSERTAREADYLRSRYGPAALVDPFHSPNQSLETAGGELAFPPRVRRPWRLERTDRPRIAFLTYRLMKGYGVDVVVAEQIEFFCARGWEVVALVLEKDGHYDSRLAGYVANGQLRILRVRSPREVLGIAPNLGLDVAVAHTPPFHEILPQLPPTILRVLFDHGEPPAELFTDALERRRIAQQKVAASREVELSVAISDFIRRDSGLRDPRVCRNGNDHLLRRRSDLARLAGEFRRVHGLGDAFLVLDVTRYLREERRYKGVEEFAAVRDALLRSRPDLAQRVRFVLAGRSDPADRSWAEGRGLFAVSDLEDEQLIAAYLDADVYLSTSQWEGYNLGVAQALALGLPTFASARGAHPEFPIRTSDDPAELARWIVERFATETHLWGVARAKSALRRAREAVVFPWKASAAQLEALLREGLQGRPGSLAKLPPPLEVAWPGEEPEVSFLILNKDKPELIEPCVRSIEERCDVPYEILVGDTGSTDPATLRFYEATRHGVHYLGFYNFSACNNILAARARGRYLLFLNNDTQLIRTRLREALDFLASHPDVGCLGAYLVYPDRRIQHAGVRICPNAPYRGIPEHFDRYEPIDGYPAMNAPRDVVAVTGAMMFIARDVFGRAGGFDEVYEEEAQDIDLCLRLRREGLRSVMHPALHAYHYENATRKVKEAPADRAEFLRRFGRLIEEELFPWQVKAGLA